MPDRPTHLNEREGDGKRNILLGWHEESAEETITVLVVENSNGGKLRIVRADGPLPISGYYFLYIRVIYKMERECAWSLEVESKLAEVILQREKWYFV